MMRKNFKFGKSMAAMSGAVALALLGFGALYNQGSDVSASESSFLSRASLRGGDVVTVPAETRIHIRLESAISTDTNSPGDRVQASLDGALMANGLILAPSRSKMNGELTKVRRGGQFGERASFTLALRTLAVGTKEYELHTLPLTLVAREAVGPNSKPIRGAAVYGPATRFTVTLSQPLRLPVIVSAR